MYFDARAAKLLKSGEKLNIEGCPGLRLVASESRRTWTYRYKSPIDAGMRQVKIGEWPAMSIAVAASKWEKLRAARDSGRDPAKEKRATAARLVADSDIVPQAARGTVREICSSYLKGHIDKRRKEKGAAEVRRMFDKMLGDTADLDAQTLTRRQAFDLIERHAHIPVQASSLKRELGAAWDYALDAGRLPESTPNWWRLIMRGKLKSEGRQLDGKKIGVVKRCLNEAEIGALLNWLPNFSRLLDDTLTLYLWTGTRGAEIVSMEGREITDEATGLWWTIPKAKTKNARHELATDLRVPLVGRAEKIVRRRLAAYGSGFLFPGEKEPHVRQKVIQESVYFRQPYCKIRETWKRTRLPVSHWAPHDLRRSARTRLSAIGCPHDVGEAVLGHMLPGVAGVYNLYGFDAERRQWITKLDTEFERLAAENLKSLSGAQRSAEAGT